MPSVYVVCWIFLQTFQPYFFLKANSVDPDQTAPRGAVWSGSTLFAKMTFKITSRRQLLWLIVSFTMLDKSFKWQHSEICFFFISARKLDLTIHANCLLRKQFARNLKPIFWEYHFFSISQKHEAILMKSLVLCGEIRKNVLSKVPSLLFTLKSINSKKNWFWSWLHSSTGWSGPMLLAQIITIVGSMSVFSHKHICKCTLNKMYVIIHQYFI